MAKSKTPTELIRNLVCGERDRAGMAALARAADVDRGNLSRFASGAAGLNGATMDKLCKHFKLGLVRA